MDINGTAAIVTGAASGLGAATAKALADAGAKVTIWDFDRALAEQMCADTGAAHVNPDLTSWDDVKSAAARTAAEMGGIDILVCNAGIAGPTVPTVDYEVADWLKVIDVDLNGVFYCCKAVAPVMVDGGYGRIVNVASIAGKEGNPNASAYSAAKAGVIALTKSLGKELAKHDIAVNCVTPAAAKTAIFDQISQQHIDYMLSKIPRERFVKVEEIANLISWLSSAENSFTTGGVFDISGGRATY